MKRKSIIGAALSFGAVVILGGGNLSGQTSSATASPAGGSAGARTDVYHVNFSHAPMGKVSALEDALKKSAASGPMPGHALGLRHEAGAAWDFVGIQHVGAKATVDAAGSPQGPMFRPLMDWHEDTFVSGPSWTEFTKQMGLDENGKGKSDTDVYVVSVYRPWPGQDDALDKFLSEPPSASGDLAVGSIVLAHLEGSSWRFLSISRYKSYADYATSEAASVAKAGASGSPWSKLRDLAAKHEDTIAVRLAP